MKTPRTFLSLAATIITSGLVLSACATADNTDNSAQRPTSTVTSTSPQPAETTENKTTTKTNDAQDTSRTTAARGQESAQPAGAQMLGTPSMEDRQDLPDGLGDLSPTDVRIGTHQGFDRVVFEFAGVGKPGWFTHYTDTPAQPGSGFPVEYQGNSPRAGKLGVITKAASDGVNYRSERCLYCDRFILHRPRPCGI